MQNSNTRYRPVENGYEITGSREFYNRILYGSHAADEKTERFFTFAGDLPLFAGAVVALGLREIQGKIKIGEGEVNMELISELHGVSSVERASFSPEAVQKMLEEQESEGAGQDRSAVARFMQKFRTPDEK